MRSLSDDDLLRRLSEVMRQSRRVEAELVALIAEVDARRIYAREATPSMFAYCTEVLHLSEPEAVLRIRVARASRQHPMLLDALRESRLHLSGIALLAPLLTRRNRESLLKRATHKSKEQIRELVAELAPRPDAPSRMRKLPDPPSPVPATDPLCPDTVDVDKSLLNSEVSRTPRTTVWPSGIVAVPPDSPDRTDLAGSTLHARGSGAPAAPSFARAPAQGEVVSSGAVSCDSQRPMLDRAGDALPAAPGSPPPARPATVEPLSPARYRVQFTASAELREKLQRLQALMRSSVPDGDLAAIIDAAVTEKLDRLEARRFGKTGSPRKTVADTETTPTSRHIPAPIRRAVHERDGSRYEYDDARGRRCAARHRLEFHHHDQPFGRGGVHSVGNVRLMCREHNLLQAELDFGREKMARFRHGPSLESGATGVTGIAGPAGARAGPGGH